MAWISVHEDVVGPKLRKLVKHSGLSRNEALGTLIVLWLWGIKNADPNGLIKSADRGDVADVISSGLSEGADAAKVVDCMVEAGWIDDCDGELYLHDWDEWQEMWYISLQETRKGRKISSLRPFCMSLLCGLPLNLPLRDSKPLLCSSPYEPHLLSSSPL